MHITNFENIYVTIRISFHFYSFGLKSLFATPLSSIMYGVDISRPKMLLHVQSKATWNRFLLLIILLKYRLRHIWKAPVPWSAVTYGNSNSSNNGNGNSNSSSDGNSNSNSNSNGNSNSNTISNSNSHSNSSSDSNRVFMFQCLMRQFKR